MSRARGSAIEQARLLVEAGKTAAAIDALRRAVARDADDPDLAAALGELLARAGQHAQAIFQFERAVRLRPQHPPFRFALAQAFKLAGRDDDSAREGLAYLRLLPPSHDRNLMLALALQRQDDLPGALEAAREAARLQPESPGAGETVAMLATNLEHLDECLAVGQAYRQRLPNALWPLNTRLFAMLYAQGQDERVIVDTHAELGRLMMALRTAPEFTPVNDPSPDRPLRVGYISQDFRNRSAAHFFEALAAHHDRASFSVLAYHQRLSEDEMTDRLRGMAQGWRDIQGLDDAAAARQIREDGVDVLVDLTGHTGSNRLGILAYRPAPVQVTYMGYAHTTGLPTVDARLVDALTDPPGSEWQATERLIRLEPSFLCYTPPPHAPEPEPRPANRPLTFGSFNSLVKLSPDTIALWARIVRARPGSVLALKAKALAKPWHRERITRALRDQGLRDEQFELRPETPGKDQHLAAYRDVDIALDPFPYNGTTTTLEALWMGVPVVTLAGQCHRARVGVSLLTNAGLPDLIASDHEAYANIALALADDQPRRAALRLGLREQLRRSPLTDGPAFTRQVEGVYRQLWQAWCARQRV
jgi:predicted O-linked N-acetylglucosamine transferase (SPINDLY family)